MCSSCYKGPLIVVSGRSRSVSDEPTRIQQPVYQRNLSLDREACSAVERASSASSAYRLAMEMAGVVVQHSTPSSLASTPGARLLRDRCLCPTTPSPSMTITS